METLLGTTDTGQFFSLFAFALIGMSISLLLNGANREVTGPTTPYKFNLGFLLLDNYKRIILNLLILFSAVRFYPDIFHEAINPFLAFGIGIGFDKIVQLIKERVGVLQVNREKITTPAETAVPKT